MCPLSAHCRLPQKCRGFLETTCLFARSARATRNPTSAATTASPEDEPLSERLSFDEIYAETFPSVWRTALRLGVPDDQLEDVLQDVYLTIFRKQAQFEGRCAAKTWALAITIRVASNYRRTRQRKGKGYALASLVVDPEIVADSAPDPHEQLARAEAIRAVHELIAGMDERRATVFTLVELGGQRVSEIAKALGTNVNTMQARLRAARRDFERSVNRRQARSGW